MAVQPLRKSMPIRTVMMITIKKAKGTIKKQCRGNPKTTLPHIVLEGNLCQPGNTLSLEILKGNDVVCILQCIYVHAWLPIMHVPLRTFHRCKIDRMTDIDRVWFCTFLSIFLFLPKFPLSQYTCHSFSSSTGTPCIPAMINDCNKRATLCFWVAIMTERVTHILTPCVASSACPLLIRQATAHSTHELD